jgi:hypothetical protein
VNLADDGEGLAGETELLSAAPLHFGEGSLHLGAALFEGSLLRMEGGQLGEVGPVMIAGSEEGKGEGER